MTSALISVDTPAAPVDHRAAIPAQRKPSPTRAPVVRPYLASVPDCEPPFDDEHCMASRIQRPRRAPALPPMVKPRVARRTVTAPDRILDDAVPGWSQEEDIGVRRTATAELPAAHRSGQLLARALVEVLSGQRPLPQLRTHCAPEVFAGLQSRPAANGGLGQLMTVRVCEPADGVAEVSAVFRRGERVKALAFRIQGVDGRWRVTALQAG